LLQLWAQLRAEVLAKQAMLGDMCCHILLLFCGMYQPSAGAAGPADTHCAYLPALLQLAQLQAEVLAKQAMLGAMCCRFLLLLNLWHLPAPGWLTNTLCLPVWVGNPPLLF
jgi:hypothetical protein